MRSQQGIYCISSTGNLEIYRDLSELKLVPMESIAYKVVCIKTDFVKTDFICC